MKVLNCEYRFLVVGMQTAADQAISLLQLETLSLLLFSENSDN